SPYFASGTTVLNVSPDGLSLVMSNPATSAPDYVKNVDEPIWFKPTGNAIAAGTDATAVYTGAGSGYQPGTFTAQLERSFDGGSTWIGCNVGFGNLASFSNAFPFSLAFGDPEECVLYRINTLTFTSTPTVNYRISTTGQ